MTEIAKKYGSLTISAVANPPKGFRTLPVIHIALFDFYGALGRCFLAPFRLSRPVYAGRVLSQGKSIYESGSKLSTETGRVFDSTP
jgi:hypothetical protein